MITRIMNRTFKRSILCICALVFVAGAVEAADKPNIVVFLTDDI